MLKFGSFVKILFLIFVIFSPMGIAPSQIALGFAFFFWFLEMFIEKKHPTPSKLDFPIFLFLLCGFVASLFGISPMHNLDGYRTMGWMLIYFLVVNNVKKEKDIKLLLEILILATAISAAYGIFQYLSHRAIRSGGIFSDHMLFAHHLVLILPFIVALFLNEERKKKKILFGLGSLIIFSSFTFTFIRSAWIGAIFGLLIMAVLKRKKGLYLIPVVIIFLASIIFIFPKTRLARRVKSIVHKTKSSQERIYLYKASFEMIKDRPILGYGWEGFRKVYPDYVSPYAIEPYLVHAHNVFLDIAIDCGIIGLGIFLWIFCLLIKFSYKIFKYGKNKYLKTIGLAGIGSFSGFLVGGLTQYNFGRSENAMLLYFLMGIIMAAYSLKDSNDLTGDLTG